MESSIIESVPLGNIFVTLDCVSKQCRVAIVVGRKQSDGGRLICQGTTEGGGAEGGGGLGGEQPVHRRCHFVSSRYDHLGRVGPDGDSDVIIKGRVMSLDDSYKHRLGRGGGVGQEWAEGVPLSPSADPPLTF